MPFKAGDLVTAIVYALLQFRLPINALVRTEQRLSMRVQGYLPPLIFTIRTAALAFFFSSSLRTFIQFLRLK